MFCCGLSVVGGDDDADAVDAPLLSRLSMEKLADDGWWKNFCRTSKTSSDVDVDVDVDIDADGDVDPWSDMLKSKPGSSIVQRIEP